MVTILVYIAVAVLGFLVGAGVTFLVGIAAVRYRQYIIDDLKIDVKSWRDEWRSSQAVLMNVLERSRQLEPEGEQWGSFVMDEVDDDRTPLVGDRDDRGGRVSLD